jgi:hypothetical protein
MSASLASCFCSLCRTSMNRKSAAGARNAGGGDRRQAIGEVRFRAGKAGCRRGHTACPRCASLAATCLGWCSRGRGSPARQSRGPAAVPAHGTTPAQGRAGQGRAGTRGHRVGPTALSLSLQAQVFAPCSPRREPNRRPCPTGRTC